MHLNFPFNDVALRSRKVYADFEELSFIRKVIDNQHKLGKKVVLISAELPYDIAAC